MSLEQTSWIVLRSAHLQAQIDPLGAQLSALRDRHGRELLWSGDPAVWAGRAPILFPIVGALAGGRYRLGERSYALPRHGFARGRNFEVVSESPASALFRLQSDQATLQVYPFEFQLDVSFEMDGPALSVLGTVRNLGSVRMPASIGFHPGFRWPLPCGQPRESHYIEFAQPETSPIRRLDTDGLVSPVRHPTPVSDRRLHLADSLFREDVIIFDDLRSRSVTYGGPTGPRIRVDFPDARYLGVWTRPGAGFVCIEPWQGIADEAGSSGDFTRKPGVFMLDPGSSRSLSMRIECGQS